MYKCDICDRQFHRHEVPMHLIVNIELQVCDYCYADTEVFHEDNTSLDTFDEEVNNMFDEEEHN